MKKFIPLRNIFVTSMLIRIYPENPNPREIDKVVQFLRDGGLIEYPTDTIYGLGCDIFHTKAVEKICRYKGIDVRKANLSFICYDLSHISEYAKVSNDTFKLLKHSKIPRRPVNTARQDCFLANL